MQATLPILKATFSPSIYESEISAFRGAFLEKVPKDVEAFAWFHNHFPDGSSRYHYPRVQYKREHHMPIMICFSEALETGKSFLNEQQIGKVKMKDHEDGLELKEVEINHFPLGLTDEMTQTYRIYNWQALNQHNYQEYQQLESLRDIIYFLEPKLIGNILSFAKAVQWHVDEKIKVEITQMHPTRYIKYKGVKIIAFNFTFRSNILLPDQIGLGKGVSRGFGNIRKLTS